MNYKDYKIIDFLNDMSSTKSMPGGGVALGLIGAISLSLIIKCINMTLGKKKYEEYELELNDTKIIFTKYFEEMIKLMDEDAINFEKMSSAFKMPKSNETEKNERNKKLNDAAISCIFAPLKLIDISRDALNLLSKIENKTTQLLQSDFDIAKEQLQQAKELSKINVKINLSYILDEKLKKEIETKLA